MKKGPGITVLEILILIVFVIILFLFFSEVLRYSDKNVGYGESVFEVYMRGNK